MLEVTILKTMSSEMQVNMPENEKAGDMAEILHVDESTSLN